jgi:hypothetical protein
MNIKIKTEGLDMKKTLIAGLFLVSVLLVSGKEYTRNEDDSVNYFYTKVIIENNKVKMITKVVDKDDKSKSYIRTLTGEIKGNKIYYNKFQINQRKERDIPVEVSVFSEVKGKLFIDNDEFIEVIKK